MTDGRPLDLIALDVSSKTGWAVFKDGRPSNWGTLFPDKTTKDFGPYPRNYVRWAIYTADRLIEDVVRKHWVTGMPIVIEETNTGKNCYSQKGLEFLHFWLNKRFEELNVDVFYLRTGEWRKLVQAKMSKEEKSLNAKIARIKKQTGLKLAKIDGKVVGKKGRKHVSIRVANDLFGLELTRSDEDCAEALLVGEGFLRGAAWCDGTTNGGKSEKI
jgi:hypothetical protein